MRNLKFIFVFLIVASTATAGEWKWVGFEVMGQKSVERSEILKNIPLKVGDNYEEDFKQWEAWCSTIQEEFNFFYIGCSSVRYSDFKAYFVIDVVENGEEQRIQFREAPNEEVELASPTVLKLYDDLYERFWKLFEMGTPPIESKENGYLDFSDGEMHGIVLKLIEIVPQYRENILRVLESDRNAQKRMTAANLLNWTVNDLEKTIATVHSLLNDPISGVRNNISRFILPFVENVQSKEVRGAIIDSLIIQLNRPTHADRNKAIYSLLKISEVFPEELLYIKEKGKNLIEYLALNSILSNVRSPAQALLEQFD